MPKNLFGGRRPNMNLSPLLALLQQQDPQLDAGGGGGRKAPATMEQLQQQEAPSPQEQPNHWSMMVPNTPPVGGPIVPEGVKNAASLGANLIGPPGAWQAIKRLPQLLELGKTGVDFAGETLGSGRIFSSPPSQATAQPMPGAPVAEGGGPAQGGGGSSLLQRLDAQDKPWKAGGLGEEQAAGMQGFGQFTGPVQEAVQDAVKQYGIAEQDHEKAMLALKQEFQDTPEIDQALAGAQQALMQARAERKQPSAWDYMAMALMNLSGVPPQTSASMVLGLEDQAQREGLLEQRVMGLEDQQAHGRMQGRRDFRGAQMQSSMAQREAEQAALQMQQRQANLDREFGFKQQDQMSDLLRSISGQEGEIERMSMDEGTRKKAGVSRDLLKQLLQIDDPALQNMIKQQRKNAAPKDQRQSRMFGNIVGDSFA